MSLQQLVQSAQGQAPTKSSPSKTTGLAKLVASATPVQSPASSFTPSLPAQPQPLGTKLINGLTKATDFLGLKGTTDVLGTDIAHLISPEKDRAALNQVAPLPSIGQQAGAALQVGSFLLPATGAERIGASLAEGALTKAALSGAAAGAQFGVLGGAGQALTEKKSAKDVTLEAAKQGTLGAAGGALLGLGGAGLSKLLSKAKPLEKVPEPVKIPVASSAEETPIKVNTPTTKHADYAASQGYEPYIPNEQLPIIQAGPKAISDLPTIQTQVNTPKIKGDLTYEPIKESVIPSVTPKTAPTATIPTKTEEVSSISRKTSIKVDKQILKDIKTDSLSTAKASNDINKKLVSQGFEELPESELSQFNSITKADQIQKVSNQLSEDPAKFTQDVIDGNIPKDIHPQVAFNAVKNKAIQEGDGEVLRALASSPISKQRSLAAQSLGASGFNNGEIDAVKAITDINKAREDKVLRTTKDIKSVMSDTVKQAKAEVKRTAPTKQTVADFIDSLTC